MKRFISILLVIVSLVAFSVPASATTTGTYNTPAVNLRNSPSTGATSQGLVSNGATCNILESKTVSGRLWYKVYITSHTLNNPDLYQHTGWSWAQFITTSGSGSNPGGGTPSHSGSLVPGYINHSGVRIRTGCSESTGIVATVTNQPIVYYNGAHNGTNGSSYQWYEVTYPYVGYVASQFVVGADRGQSVSYYNICPVCHHDMDKIHEVLSLHHANYLGQINPDIPGGETYWELYARACYKCPNCLITSYGQVDGKLAKATVSSDIYDRYHNQFDVLKNLVQWH